MFDQHSYQRHVKRTKIRYRDTNISLADDMHNVHYLRIAPIWLHFTMEVHVSTLMPK